MDTKEYIASGILELYVLGALSEKENGEVYALIQQHKEIKAEVVEIEKALSLLSEAVSPTDSDRSFSVIKDAITHQDKKVVSMAPKRDRNRWISYVGWAASVVLASGLFWMYNQNQTLNTEIESITDKNMNLERQLTETNDNLDNANSLVDILRDKNISSVALAGQAAAPDAFAKVYIKEDENRVYIDALGLPEPPEGKEYQVWSLKLDPLTPTSMGLLADFKDDKSKVFELTDTNDAEAFGITLEPEGGSESPTLEQLYVLGVVSP